MPCCSSRSFISHCICMFVVARYSSFQCQAPSPAFIFPRFSKIAHDNVNAPSKKWEVDIKSKAHAVHRTACLTTYTYSSTPHHVLKVSLALWWRVPRAKQCSLGYTGSRLAVGRKTVGYVNQFILIASTNRLLAACSSTAFVYLLSTFDLIQLIQTQKATPPPTSANLLLPSVNSPAQPTSPPTPPSHPPS